MVKKVDLAWAAGFIEGEGSISIAKKSTVSRYDKKYFYYSLQIVVGQINPLPLERLQKLFGGSLYGPILKEGKRPFYRWQISSKAASEMLEKIAPYMSSKLNEVEIALKFQSITRRVGVKGIPEKVSLEMKGYYDNLKKAHSLIWESVN